MTELLPRARKWSRVLAVGALASSRLPVGRAGSVGVQQAVVLGALALGMPHGAADTELLRSAAAGSVRRHVALAVAYAALGVGSTMVVRRGGGRVERAVLLASAAHFGEGELACWRLPPRVSLMGTVLRMAAATLTTVGLPAAVGTANRRPAEIGVSGALTTTPPRGMGDRTGLELLRDPATRRVLAPLTGLAGAATAALALAGDREAAQDSALLGCLALLAPPATAFATYFGGWHALRHTARVVDALVADGQLPVQRSLPGAIGTLGRRSGWAAAVGLVAAGGLAAADPENASDNAFAAVLGLTMPHMTTVALQLTRRGR
ncbi:MAG: Brp/Blh family beta-carotene 15,15'-dioxygenase [Actinomycetota bacterium]|nr:Brp/Blh family beta-carotene 15,15'-dioxygenase [Actinomycetota bacterium]